MLSHHNERKTIKHFFSNRHFERPKQVPFCAYTVCIFWGYTECLKPTIIFLFLFLFLGTHYKSQANCSYLHFVFLSNSLF